MLPSSAGIFESSFSQGWKHQQQSNHWLHDDQGDILLFTEDVRDCARIGRSKRRDRRRQQQEQQHQAARGASEIFTVRDTATGGTFTEFVCVFVR